MANVFNAARYILDETGPVSTWKLQKLCYYAQAWSLAWTGKELFPEDFEAWANGPVCPELYYRHSGRYSVSKDNFSAELESEPDFTDDEKDTIDRVIAHYGAWEPYALREQTHHEDPWKNARGNLPEGARCNTIISKDSMGLYYGSL